MYLVKNVFLISIFPQVKICTAKKTCPYVQFGTLKIDPSNHRIATHAVLSPVYFSILIK